MFELIKLSNSDYALMFNNDQIASVKHVSDVDALKSLIQQSNENNLRRSNKQKELRPYHAC
ncbi:curlin-associated protein [Roseibium sp. TrichSKD4]|uniref:hypothetical protein n=1 Tax=Roseibium sp. TrichSKD4 TaxID=744980 RepID=UPI0001E56FCD|nr:hypothetical protein [Roseibium sp. TrichSKD4]EFO31350.1 curlin-associated protein [Roseibium sp. TrichSKD4]